MEVTQEAENLNEVGGEGGAQHGEEGVRNEVLESQGEDMMCNPGILVERLEALVDNMEPSKIEVENKEAVLESLRRVLGNRFPEVELFPYGSSESGLAFPGCDLDVFVFLGDEEEETLGGYYDEADYGRAITKEVAMLLRNHPSKRYRGARAILANTPIVRVRDSATKVSCDLNMRNRMGLLNTAYIRFCASFDDRARDLMMVVKAFCKRHQLTDHGGDHLNNYSLVMMVITYLQIQGVLHPLYQLQEVPGLQPKIVNGYNFAFCTDRALLPPLSHNPDSLLHLLEGFLDYFAFFPFDTHAICPFAGQEVAVEDLRSGTNLPPCLADKDLAGAPDRLRAISILDPFELRRNVSHMVLPYNLRNLVKVFDMGARVLQVALEGRDNQDILWEMLFEEGFYRFRYVFEPDPITGLLPGYDRIADPAAGKEKSMDQSDGEARNQNGEELLGTTLRTADEGEVEKIIEAEENGLERVVEADTSDEEPEFFNGEVKYRGCKQVLEVRETSSVPDNMDNFYTNYYYSEAVHGRIMKSKAGVVGEIPPHQNVKNKAYDPPSYMNLDTMGLSNRDEVCDASEALVNNREIELVVDVDDSDEEVDASYSVKFDGSPVRVETTHVNLENIFEGNPTLTSPKELKTLPERVVTSLVKLETILEVSELGPEESFAIALVDAEDSDEEELDNMNFMVTDLVVDVENNEEEEEEVISEWNKTSHVNPETCPVTQVTISVECETFPGRDKSLGKLETILEVSEPESEGSAARALVVEEESDEEELENMILMVTDLVVDVENSEEEVEFISSRDENSFVNLETRLVTFENIPVVHDTNSVKLDSFPVKVKTIPVEHETIPERLKGETSVKLETIIEVSELESKGSPKRPLGVDDSDEDIHHIVSCVSIFQRRKLGGLIQPTRN